MRHTWNTFLYIFLPRNGFKYFKPSKNRAELGREYKFGTLDCFEAMRDYLKTQNIEIPPRIPFEDNWFNKDLDYFSPEIVKEWGGKEIPLENIQKK